MLLTPIINFKKQLSLNALFNSVFILAGSNVLAQFISVSFMPILTRLYSPSEFGASSIYSSILSIAIVIASGSYEFAIPVQVDSKKAYNNIFLCIFLTFFTSIILGLGLFFYGDLFIIKTQTQILRPYLWIMPFGLIASSVYQIISYWAIRRKIYPILSRTKLIQSASGSLFSTGTGLLYKGPLGLIVGGIISQSAGILMLWKDIAALKSKEHLKISAKEIYNIAFEFKQFPFYSSGASLLNIAGLVLPPVILSFLYGPVIAGYFAIAFKVVTLPMAVIGRAFSQVFLAEASSIHHDNAQKLPDFFSKITRKTVWLSLLPLSIGLLAPFLFSYIFGNKWKEAGYYVAILSISGIARIIVSPISSTAIIAKRQDIQFLLDLLRTILVLIALYLPYKAGYSSIYSVAAYSLSMTFIYIISFFLYRKLAFATVNLKVNNLKMENNNEIRDA